MSDFRTAQKQLTDHIRNPAECAGPEGIEPRRLNIYRDLFYRNIESFLSSAFPVTCQLFSEEAWEAMVRDFMVHHRCQTPYFLKISEEFLAYLSSEREPADSDPPFLLELAHYEWVELALDVADIELDELDCDPDGDLMEEYPVVSPLSWSLGYRFPVHRIGSEYQPAQAPEQPTYLVVYRNSRDEVKFLESNALTARLLALLEEDRAVTGRRALQQMADELPHADAQELLRHGEQLLIKLRELGIILGTTPDPT